MRRKALLQPAPTIRVLIADDHPVVRHGLAQVLRDTPDIVPVGEAANAHEVLERVRRDGCDVLLRDLAMPGAHGLEVLEAVKRERPRVAVLVLSVYPEDQFAVRAIRAGAAGYMTKNTAADELVRAVRKVVTGGRYLTPRVAEILAAHLDRAADRPLHDSLSTASTRCCGCSAEG